MKTIIALDAGTTSIRAFLYDIEKNCFIHCARQEVSSRFPRPAWVEQDAEEIYYKAAYVLNDCARAAGDSLIGVSVTNQRETVVAWDAESGGPIAPAIVWQCRRTSDFCASIPEERKKIIRGKTGLVPDAYFSASKIRWLLDNVDKAKACLARGTLRVGTVETYLIWKLTEGRSFLTDHTNASRTMLFNIHTLDWDEDLLEYFEIPREILARPVPSDAGFGSVMLGSRSIPIAGAVGDQQAALVGQACLHEGECKVTYGTGLFMLLPTAGPAVSSCGLLTTIGSAIGGKVSYALEGSVFHAGSSIQWLRDEVGLLETAEESERLARSVKDTGGVVFVPAFTGLGAPHWSPAARGMLTGISRGTKREHIVRAVLESIAYSARELADCMAECGKLTLIRCDGGASANDFLMQLQADVLHIPVDRPKERESTALGAAFIGAIALGEREIEDIPRLRNSEHIFSPARGEEAERGYLAYCDAVRRVLL